MVSDEMKSKIQECARKSLADANGDVSKAALPFLCEILNLTSMNIDTGKVNSILESGNNIYGRLRDLRMKHEAQEETTVTVADDLHSMAVSMPKMPDYYAKLAGTKWTVIDEPFKPSASIQSFLDASSSVRDSEYDDAIKRFAYLSGKIRDGNIDIRHLSHLGSRLDVILWHTRETEQWEEYKKYYDEGIQLMELLSHMRSDDPLVCLENVIYGIVLTYEGYKDIQC